MEEFKKYLHALAPLKEETWQKILPIFTLKKVKKGQFFAKSGEKALHIGFMKTGIIRAFFTNNEGVEYNKHFFMPHTLVGAYASLIAQTTNTIAQQALTDCEIWVGEYQKLTALYDTCPDLERISRKYAEYSYVYKEIREIDIVLLDADKRYALFQKEYPQLEQFIPQYHIASYLGITPTQLSRIRKKLSAK